MFRKDVRVEDRTQNHELSNKQTTLKQTTLKLNIMKTFLTNNNINANK